MYNLVYNIRNNKHIIFAIWLSKLPENGTFLKLSTFNKKFGLNYKTTKDFCFKFLKPIRINLNKFNTLSFNYRYEKDTVFIIPYPTKITHEVNLFVNTEPQLEISRRMNYFQKRYGLIETEMSSFFHQYRNIPQTRELIEKAFREFIRNYRLKKIKSTKFQGKAFLNEIQQFIILIYRETKMGKLMPNAYPNILWIRNCTHPNFGFALTKVKETLKTHFSKSSFRNCTHQKTQNHSKLLINPKNCG